MPFAPVWVVLPLLSVAWPPRRGSFALVDAPGPLLEVPDTPVLESEETGGRVVISGVDWLRVGAEPEAGLEDPGVTVDRVVAAGPFCTGFLSLGLSSAWT